MRLYPHFFHAAVPAERRRRARESRILDTQTVLLLRLLEARPQRRPHHGRANCRTSRRVDGGGRRVHGHHAAVRCRIHVGLAACVRHRDTWIN